MKRCNGSNKETQCFKFTPVGRLYKQERMVKEESVSAVQIRRSKEEAESKKEN
jgi:hypothetical protein